MGYDAADVRRKLEKRVAQLETALEIALSVRMLDNLTPEQWARVQAARGPGLRISNNS